MSHNNKAFCAILLSGCYHRSLFTNPIDTIHFDRIIMFAYISQLLCPKRRSITSTTATTSDVVSDPDYVPLQHTPFTGEGSQCVISPEEACESCRDLGIEGLLRSITTTATTSAMVSDPDYVPLQHTPFTGEDSQYVISPEKACESCRDLGVEGLLRSLNTVLGTDIPISHPGTANLLQRFVDNDYDFGATYARVRRIWRRGHEDPDADLSDVFSGLEAMGEEAEEARKRSLDPSGQTILNPYDLPPRRIWDLYAHRVVPLHFSWHVFNPYRYWAVSHSWTDDMLRVESPVNTYEWPVPLPHGVTLEAVRTELLNLDAEYVWLDVLCLRQQSSSPREALRAKEWATDVPTIGNAYIYGAEMVVRYYNGLGKAFRRSGWQDERHWLKRAWTLLEIKAESVSAGIPPDITDPLEEFDEDHSRRLHDYMPDSSFEFGISILSILRKIRPNMDPSLPLFAEAIKQLRMRSSTNPVDKVAVISMFLQCPSLPIYRESDRPEEAWTRCVKHVTPDLLPALLFCFPVPGDEGCRWRASWKQLMEGGVDPIRIQLWRAETDVMKIYPDGSSLSVTGPVISECSVSEWQVSVRKRDDDPYQRGVIRAENGGKWYEFQAYAEHEHVIQEGQYTLVGNAWMTRWAVCAKGAGDKLEKVSVMCVDWEKAYEMRSAGICSRQTVILA